MSQTALKNQAISLRKQGKTYSEIRSTLNIPKSTLSDWLQDYPLSQRQLRILQKNITNRKQLASEKTSITKLRKWEARLRETYENEQKWILPLSKKEAAIAGLFLYWGEGNKNLKNSLSVSNTNPSILLFTLYWMTEILGVPKEKIKIFLHLYSDMDINTELGYWSTFLNVPLEQFSKPYIKKTLTTDITQKGFRHGTCTLAVNDVLLKEKVMMGIKVLSLDYSTRIEPML